MIITIAQQKGGAGKTSLALHLAVAWAGQKKRVVALDIDPQGSLTEWDRVRTEKLGPVDPHVVALSGWRVASELERHARSSDVVVIDSPPHAETDARVAIRSANLVLVPLQPSLVDLWATRATLDLAAKERRPVLLVLNRVPSRSRAAEEVAREAAELGVPTATTTIGNRVALATAFRDGRGITESDPSSAAGQEIIALAAEVLKRARVPASA